MNLLKNSNGQFGLKSNCLIFFLKLCSKGDHGKMGEMGEMSRIIKKNDSV